MSDILRARLRTDLTAAMKRRDRPATAAIRAALGAIDNAEAVDATDVAAVADFPSTSDTVIAGAVDGLGRSEVARRTLSDDAVVALIRQEISTRTTAADDYDAIGGRAAEAAVTLRAEAAALRIYVER